MNRFLAVLACLMLSTPAAAEVTREGDIELTAQIAGHFWDNETGLEADQPFGGGRIGYFITDALVIEAAVFAGSTKNPVAGLQRTNVLQPTLELLYTARKDQMESFIGGGIGILDADGTRGETNDTDVIVPIGGGVKYFFNDYIGIRYDGRLIFSPEGGDEFLQGAASLGLTLALP